MLRSAFTALGSLAVILPLALAACGDDTSTGAGGGGTGGGAGGSNPLVIDSPEDTWTWVDFPESVCMSGTPTGLAINKSSTSDDVVIVLQGGNACFNTASCGVTANAKGYGKTEFDEELADGGSAFASPYFDRTNPDNPFKDMSFVNVAYCSGDLHFGSRSDVTVAGKVRQFHGHDNVAAFLTRLVPTFKNAKRVVLLGFSAGGFGVALNYEQVATAFGPGVDVVLLDDSGPPLGTDYVSACLQAHLADIWGYESTLCPTCIAADGSFTELTVKHLTDTYPNASLNLISSEQDKTIRTLAGYGLDDCVSLDELVAPTYDPQLYTDGLHDLRDRVAAGTNFRMFLLPGEQHVWLDGDFTTPAVDGVKLHDWVVQAITHDPAPENVPAN